MSLPFVDNFAIKMQKPNIERDSVALISDLKELNLNYYPAVFPIVCLEDGKLYILNKSNDFDETTGYCRVVSGSGGGIDEATVKLLIKNNARFADFTAATRYYSGKIEDVETEITIAEDITSFEYFSSDTVEIPEEYSSELEYSTFDTTSESGTYDNLIWDSETKTIKLASTTPTVITYLNNDSKTIKDIIDFIYNEEIKSAELDADTNKLKLTQNDDTTIEADLSSILAAAKEYTDSVAEGLTHSDGIACDEKPVYDAETHTVTYKVDGVEKTKVVGSKLDTWFFYSDGTVVYQVAYIDEKEFTIKYDSSIDFNDFLKKSDPAAEGALSMNRKEDTTVGDNSTTLGSNNTATGDSSLAIGTNTEATGENSVSEGEGTIASSDNQHVSGTYNVPDSTGTYVDIVGGGTSSEDQKNIYALDKDGNIYITGDVYVEGTNADGTGGTKLQKELSWDSTPTAGSTNAMTSSAIYDALTNYQKKNLILDLNSYTSDRYIQITNVANNTVFILASDNELDMLSNDDGGDSAYLNRYNHSEDNTYSIEEAYVRLKSELYIKLNANHPLKLYSIGGTNSFTFANTIEKKDYNIYISDANSTKINIYDYCTQENTYSKEETEETFQKKQLIYHVASEEDSYIQISYKGDSTADVFGKLFIVVGDDDISFVRNSLDAFTLSKTTSLVGIKGGNMYSGDPSSSYYYGSYTFFHLQGGKVIDIYTLGDVNKIEVNKSSAEVYGGEEGEKPIYKIYRSDEVDDLLATKQDALTFDDTPTEGSTNPVTSKGIYNYIENHSSSTLLDVLNLTATQKDKQICDIISNDDKSINLYLYAADIDAGTEIVFGNGVFAKSYQNGDGGAIAISSDGVNWTDTLTFDSSSYRHICWTGQYFVVCNYVSSTNKEAIHRSENGTNWIQMTTRSGWWSDGLKYGNGVLVSLYGTPYYSTDYGETWTASGFGNFTAVDLQFDSISGYFYSRQEGYTDKAVKYFFFSPDGKIWYPSFASSLWDVYGVTPLRYIINENRMIVLGYKSFLNSSNNTYNYWWVLCQAYDVKDEFDYNNGYYSNTKWQIKYINKWVNTNTTADRDRELFSGSSFFITPNKEIYLSIFTGDASAGDSYSYYLLNSQPNETGAQIALQLKALMETADDVDIEEGSKNLVSSGKVYTALQAKQNVLTFDSTPVQNSTNPVTSGGVYIALAAKQGTLTFDDTPTKDSNNPVTSGGVYTSLAAKQNTLTFDSTPTEDSTNPVTSGGVYTALNSAGVPKISATSEIRNYLNKSFIWVGEDKTEYKSYSSVSEYEVIYLRTGFMYYVSESFTPSETTTLYHIPDVKMDKMAIDQVPTNESYNLVYSSGIKVALDKKQNTLVFDKVPNYNSENPVWSGGVYSELQKKQDTLTFDGSPFINSTNPVTSKGLYNKFLDKIDVDGTNGTEAGMSQLMCKFGTETTDPVDADYYITQTTGGGTSDVTYKRKPISSLWSYIKTKIVTKLISYLAGGEDTSTITDMSTTSSYDDRQIPLKNKTVSESDGGFRWFSLSTLWSYIGAKMSSSGTAASATTATTGKRLSNTTITIQTGDTKKQSITLQTLMTWLITTKEYIPSGTKCTINLHTKFVYADNDILQLTIGDTDYELQLAGVLIEFMGYATSYNTGIFRLRIHSGPKLSFTATSGYTKFPVDHIAEYTCCGSSYSPAWRMIKTSTDDVLIPTSQPTTLYPGSIWIVNG